MKNKNKYKRESTVFGILTAVFFVVMVVFYCVFSKVDVEEKKELATVIAFVVVGSFVLFLCFSVLFIVFNILRSSYMKKMMKETNQLEKLEMESEEIVDKKEPLYHYSDSKIISLGSYMKGTYYSSVSLFYVFLSLALLSYLLLYLPLNTSKNTLGDWIPVIVVIICFNLLFLLVFVFVPLNSYLTAKKNRISAEISLYDDRIRIQNCSEHKELSPNAKVTVDFEISYRRMIKARKDKSYYYFNYLNEKGKNVCLIITYKGLEKNIADFYQNKMIEINNVKH